ncbi:MAG TPA: hypothetical protein VF809_03195 [Candidatus Saccharimonadales bacterium]
MSSPERVGYSPWRKWFLQFTLAATATCALLGTAELIGSETTQDDIATQQRWDRESQDREIERAAYYSANPGKEKPIMVISNPRRPIEPLQRKAAEHRNNARDYGWLGFLSVFLAGSTAGASLAKNRNTTRASVTKTPSTQRGAGVLRTIAVYETDTCDVASATSYSINNCLDSKPPSRYAVYVEYGHDPIPAEDEIDSSYCRTFEPTTYHSASYDSEGARLTEMMATYELPLNERISHRIFTALAARREADIIHGANERCPIEPVTSTADCC